MGCGPHVIWALPTVTINSSHGAIRRRSAPNVFPCDSIRFHEKDFQCFSMFFMCIYCSLFVVTVVTGVLSNKMPSAQDFPWHDSAVKMQAPRLKRKKSFKSDPMCLLSGPSLIRSVVFTFLASLHLVFSCSPTSFWLV